MEDGINNRRLHHHVGGATEGGGGASDALSLSLPLPPTTKLHALPRIATVVEASAAVAVPEERSGGGGGGREDVWSQGATLMLIDAWGDRYLDLNRGNLKQKHWKEVADAVNSRPGGNNKQPKTDVQCKNRLDTLKKKYKVEKTRIFSGAATKWALFNRMDDLIGPSRKHQHHHHHEHKHHHHSPPPLPATVSPPSPVLVMPNTTNNYSNHHEQHTNNTESLDMTESWANGRRKRARARARAQAQKNDYAVALKEVASSIVRFGEVYERIEGMKQQQMIDLEKQRMEFIKDLELERMQLFMHTQFELAKIKHGSSTEHYL